MIKIGWLANQLNFFGVSHVARGRGKHYLNRTRFHLAIRSEVSWKSKCHCWTKWNKNDGEIPIRFELLLLHSYLVRNLANKFLFRRFSLVRCSARSLHLAWTKFNLILARIGIFVGVGRAEERRRAGEEGRDTRGNSFWYWIAISVIALSRDRELFISRWLVPRAKWWLLNAAAHARASIRNIAFDCGRSRYIRIRSHWNKKVTIKFQFR